MLQVYPLPQLRVVVGARQAFRCASLLRLASLK